MINFIKRRFSAEEEASTSLGSGSGSGSGSDPQRNLLSDLQVQLPKFLDSFSTMLPNKPPESTAPPFGPGVRVGGSMGNLPMQVAAQNGLRPQLHPGVNRSQSQTRPPMSEHNLAGNTGRPILSEQPLSGNTGRPMMSEQNFSGNTGRPMISEQPLAGNTGRPMMSEQPLAGNTGRPMMSEQNFAGNTGRPGPARGPQGPRPMGPGSRPPEKRGPEAQQEPQRSLMRETSPNPAGKRTIGALNNPGSPMRAANDCVANGFRGLLVEAPRSCADERRKVLLVIDEGATDWSKYFAPRRLIATVVDLNGCASSVEHEIRVEQSTFQDLLVLAYSEHGALVQTCGNSCRKQSLNGDSSVSSQTRANTRTFKPDFVLVRQAIRNGTQNWAHVIIALDYAGVPAVNSLPSVYAFQDKPWIFSQLLKLKRRFGQQHFPVIEQAFLPFPATHVNLSTWMLPVVVKIGHSHAGVGKIRAESLADALEAANLAAVANTYCTVEPFVEAKCDLRVQKIGNNYKAFLRKSLSGNWKANVGSAMLEQVAVSEQQRRWVDEFSAACGGLDIMALELVQGKDGQAYIIDAVDSSMALLGDSQEDDRRLIADLVMLRMQQAFGGPEAVSAGGLRKPATLTPTHAQVQSMHAQVQPTHAQVQAARRMLPHEPPFPGASPLPSNGGVRVQAPAASPSRPFPSPRADVNGFMARAPMRAANSQPPVRLQQLEATEDTMQNLRSSFAGIFGEMPQ